jgi:Protein of unknown function (DUF3667)
MSHICKNCHHEFTGNFCNHCGQSADTHEINAHFLWHDIQHGLFHFDKGLFYSIKKLATAPGHAIKAYINGQRAYHFKPISFLFLMATIYGFLSHYLDEHFDTITNKITINNNDSATWEWLEDHYAIYSIIVLPLLSLASYLAFRKQHFNYVQHLVMHAYLMGFELVIKILLDPLLKSLDLDQYSCAIILLGGAFKLWAFVQIFDYLKKRQLIYKLIWMYFYTAIIFGLLFLATIIKEAYLQMG